MQASKKIPFEDENVLWGVRGMYLLSNLIIFGMYFYMGMKIDKLKGKFTISQQNHCAHVPMYRSYRP